MFVDSRELNYSDINADICIVGAGAAGITIARELIGTSLNVVLLESGGLDYEQETQDLYKGETGGLHQPPLDASRLRYLGGATNHWNGNIWPLFPDDLEQRPWLLNSGWPISWEELNRHYPKAAEIVQIQGPNYWTPDRFDDLIAPLFVQPQLKNNDILKRVISQHSPPTRFGQVYRQDLKAAKNVTTYLHANVVDVRTNDDCNHARSVEVKTLSGTGFKVNAKAFVIALGAIENARILLCANKQAKNGLGNDYDLVGRYFQDHLHTPNAASAIIKGPTIWSLRPTEASKLGINCYLSLQNEIMAKEGIPRSILNVIPDWEKISANNGIFDKIDRMISFYTNRDDSDVVSLRLTMEQYPNPDSRVSLIDARDSLGMQRVLLDWKMASQQSDAVNKTLDIMGRAFAASGLGRFKLDGEFHADNTDIHPLETSFHHMGTTRMHADPTKGVVDGNSRIHGIDNLYMAGSSVFTTTGVSNPTLTIVALSLRLAAHLKKSVTPG